MAASNTDLLRKAGANRISKTLTATKVIGAGTVTLNNTTGIPTDTGVDVTIYSLDADNLPDETTAVTYTGTVSGSTITNLVVAEGTDQEHDIGDIAIITLTASQWDDAMSAILVHSNQDGTLKADTVDTTQLVDDAATTAKVVDGAITGAKLGTPVAFEATRTTAQVIASGTPVKVAVNTEVRDDGGVYDNVTNYRFTAPYSGWYSFSARVAMSTLGDGVLYGLSWYKNGSELESANSGNQGGPNSNNFGGVLVTHLAASDYIEIYATQSSGANRNLSSARFTGYLMGRTD